MMCATGYADILVYKITYNLNPSIEFTDANLNLASGVYAEKENGYLILDVNINTWELNYTPKAIFYGGTGDRRGTYFDVNDANGNADFKVFDVNGKTYKGMLIDLGWDDQQEIVGSVWSKLYGKTGKTDIGKGIGKKSEIAGSLKGIVEAWADANNPFFEGFGNITATLDSKYTQNANKAAEPNQDDQDDIAADIIFDLNKQGYDFDKFPPTVSKLTVDIIGPGRVEPNYDGRLLKVGETYSMTAKMTTGVRFDGWTGSKSSSVPKLEFEMASDSTFTATFVDEQNPTITVTSPKAGQVLSNGVITATGKAKDNVAVASVRYKLNDESMWHLAKGTTKWNTAKLILQPGTNTICASAMDSSGNPSADSNVSFRCDTAFNINSINTDSAPPFSFLTIKTIEKIDPTKAFVVRFFDSNDFEVDVPAIQVDPNFVVVSVPPYINPATNELGQAEVYLQIIQTSAPTNVFSDAVPFTIEDLPEPSLDAGIITQSFLQGSLDEANSLKSDISGTPFDTAAMRKALTNYIKDVNSFLDKIESVVQTPTTSFSPGKLGGIPVTIDIAALRNTDRIVVGFVQAHASDDNLCGAAEAQALADAMLGSDANALEAAVASYNDALTDCDVNGFKSSYDITGGALGAGIGLALMTTPVPAENNVLPTTALFCVTIEDAGAVIAVGEAVGRDTISEAREVQSEVNNVNGILSPGLTKQIAKSQGNLRTLGQDAKSVYDAFIVVPLQTYKLTIEIVGDGSGEVTVSPPPNEAGGIYIIGTEVTLTADADDGSAFIGWLGNVAGGAKSVKIRMNGNKTVSATFNKAFQTWRITKGDQRAVVAVDKSGHFTGFGWIARVSGIGVSVPIYITDGIMSGNSTGFKIIGSGSGGIFVNGTAMGNLNASFPDGTSASGKVIYTVTRPPYDSYSNAESWFAVKLE